MTTEEKSLNELKKKLIKQLDEYYNKHLSPHFLDIIYFCQPYWWHTPDEIKTYDELNEYLYCYIDNIECVIKKLKDLRDLLYRFDKEN